MTGKAKILEVIGEGKSDLLLMDKVRRALQANERVKYLLTLLQYAQSQAKAPSPNPDDLSVERRRAGIEDAWLDQVVPRAELTAEGRLRIPGGRGIVEMAIEETRKMCEPLVVARRPEAPRLAERLETVNVFSRAVLDGVGGEPGAAGKPSSAAASPAPKPSDGDTLAVPLDFIARLTSGERGGADSLHLVVMDAHKAINGLISELSGRRESVGGADAIGITDEDRELLAAFMRGVNATRHLKGSHPGLATTAVRMGPKLLIQNDVGETDAHVVVLEVEGPGDGARPAYRLEVTYTDVHEKRIQFFSKLVEESGIQWKRTESRYSPELTESAFTLVRGVLKTEDRDSVARALEIVGSSLVFLIDWNKARKRLRNFVRGEEVLEVLLWAAKNRVGHMAFLTYGDEELIYEALEALPRGTIRRGEPFNAILGRKGSVEFLQDALRLALESYERKEPRALLLDRLRCILFARVQRRGIGADEMLRELAGLAVEAALTFRDALRSVSRPVPGLIARSHRRICAWEETADERLNRIRKIHLKESQPLLPVGACVDDALDALEDAIDIAHAVESHGADGNLPAETVDLLERGAETAVRAAQLFYRILHRYRELVRGGTPERLFDLINELKQAEGAGDEIKRELRWKLLSSPGDPRVLVTLRELGEHVEEAINSLKRAGFLIHDLAYAAMERIHG